MPLGFPVDGFASALTYSPRPGDLIVSTYPKCGTTWMQYLVYLLVHAGEPLRPGESLGDAFPHLEEVGAPAIEALPEPRLIKTHLPLDMAPYRPATGAKYIYVARNPFDCAVSFFHHTRGFVQHYDFAAGTFDEFFECFIAGEVDFGDYFEHLVEWHARRDDEGLKFVTYETMRADIDRVIVEVGTFLGGDVALRVRDPSFRERVRAASSFSSMRADQRRWSSERPAGMPEFVRKGVVGDFRAHFSPEQARRLLERFEQRTGGRGAFDLWPDIVAAARVLAASGSTGGNSNER